MDDVLASLASPALAGRAAEIARPRKWQALHRSGPLVWGSYRGSALYEVAADLDARRFRCTCPVRARPCKHALALFAIAVREPGALEESEPPPPLALWRQEAPRPRALPGDASREAREETVSIGVDDLDRWLRDLVRGGVASLPGRPYAGVEQAARRLVDAKAPGLAGLVRDLGASAATGTGWQERVVERLGRLYLLIEAWRRRDLLPSDLRADVSSMVGIPVYQQEVLAREPVRDRWAVLGEQLTEDDDRRTLRTWLWGRESGRAALVLQFEFAGQTLDRSLRPGFELDAALCFYPSAWPLRALVASRGRLEPMRLFAGESLAAAHARYLDAVSLQPWVRAVAVPLDRMRVERRERLLLIDDDHEVEALTAAPWALLALSGGRPLGVFGEWDGRRFSVLSAWSGDRLVAL